MLDYYHFTHRGGRNHNEDAVACQVNGDNGVFVVCDGLGGHQRGEVASAAVRDVFIQNCLPGMRYNAQWMLSSFDQANQHLMTIQNEQRCMMKSTAVVLALNEKRACWANSGDSRLYYIHNHEICAYTEDHSVAYKKYKSGEITRNQLRTDEDQSALLKALGNPERWEPDITEWPYPVEAGDAFLLCSDGIWEYLQDDEIAIDLLKSDNAKEWAGLLLLRIIERVEPGHDNLTLLTLRIE